MECPTCGARTPLAASVQPMAMRAPYGPQFAVDAPALCPRCRFMGPGMTYFTRGANLAKLAAWAFVTSWFFGFAGIIYFLSHKDDRVCPRCGQSWGKHGEVGHALAARMGALPAGAGAMPAVVDMDEGPEKWSGGAITAFVIAAIMAFAGIANFAAPPIILAMMLAGGGVFLQKHSRREREARREALLAALQQPVLQLAAQRRGRLTVTDVASQLGWPMPRAEKVLISLDDGVRVNSDVTDEGVIVYEFRELTHTPALGAPRSGIAPPQRQRPSASA
jgi:hypothetical protein